MNNKKMYYEIMLRRLNKFSKDSNMRFSKERELLLEEICHNNEMSDHFDADELFAIMKTKGAKVSRATIFRNLSVFVKASILRKVKLGESHSHYEICNNNKYKHDHLVCENCGKVVEFFEPSLLKKQKEIADSYGFEMRDHKHEIYGLCKDCQNKKNDE
ncbi:MAG: transcriptional repressor [Candidatus Delongbacteria bacterium]|nr:transcriptional repressor [Candidatus Delongbacteria bacterium]MBN2834813.1 transcriptional repressor [Candidatus Delongbacteria bacterium]